MEDNPRRTENTDGAVPATRNPESLSPKRLRDLAMCAESIVVVINAYDVKGRELCKLRLLVEMLLE